jgi:hypothetical protein
MPSIAMKYRASEASVAVSMTRMRLTCYTRLGHGGGKFASIVKFQAQGAAFVTPAASAK